MPTKQLIGISPKTKFHMCFFVFNQEFIKSNIEPMPQSPSTYYVDSKIEFSPSQIEQPIDPSSQFIVEWSRILPNDRDAQLFKSQPICPSALVNYHQKLTYMCSPFDYGCIISSKLYKIGDGSNNSQQAANNTLIDEISFGPIEGPGSLYGKLQIDKTEQIEIILNKTVYQKTQMRIILPKNETSGSRMNISLAMSDFSLTLYFKTDHCEGEQLPIKLYEKEENVIGIYIYHQYHQFMDFLRKLKICCHYGKYLKIACRDVSHRNQILFKMLSCYDKTFGCFLQKSEQNPEYDKRPCNKIYLNIENSNKKLGSDNNSNLMNTFGKRLPQQYFCESSESGEISDSPYFRSQNLKSEFGKTTFPEIQKAYNKTHEQKLPNLSRNNSELSSKPPEMTKQLNSINDELEHIFGENDEDDFYLSPSEHMIEDIYNILYTPYSNQPKDRKHSFSDINDFFLKDSLSNSNNLIKKQSKKSLKLNDEPKREVKFRETLDNKKSDHFIITSIDKIDNHDSPIMQTVPEQTSAKTSQTSKCQEMFQSIKNYEKTDKASTKEFLSEKNIPTMYKTPNLSPQQIHNFIRRQSFLRQKIEYLTKLNEQLMRQNIHLKSVLKFERDKKEKLDLMKMNEIKQMALTMVKRLENVEHQKLYEADKLSIHKDTRAIIESKYKELQKQRERPKVYKTHQQGKRITHLRTLPNIGSQLSSEPVGLHNETDKKNITKLNSRKSLKESKIGMEQKKNPFHKKANLHDSKLGVFGKQRLHFIERKGNTCESPTTQNRRQSSLKRFQQVISKIKAKGNDHSGEKNHVPAFLKKRTSEVTHPFLNQPGRPHQHHSLEKSEHNKNRQSLPTRGNTFTHGGHNLQMNPPVIGTFATSVINQGSMIFNCTPTPYHFS